MNINQKLDAVFSLVERLRIAGIEAIVAGGCSRDIYHGKDPKDFDIIVDDWADPSLVVATLSDIQEFSIGAFFPMYDHDSSDRIKWCQKGKVNGVDVDVIAYAIPSVGDAPNHFDFNLNQYMTVKLNHIAYLTSPCWKDDPKDGLVAIRGDHSEKREAYIKAKWEEFYNGSHG